MRRNFVLRVLAAYALCRAFSVVLIAIVARYQTPMAWTGPHPNYFSMTVLWDGFWHGQIAQVGYPSSLPVEAVTGAVRQNAWAFYPAFPMMSRFLMRVTGLGFPVAASTLALLVGFGAAVLMGPLLRDWAGPKVALAAVLVFAAFPVSPSLQIAYTASLTILLLCGFLWAVGKERWILTAGLALLIGLSRAMALPMAVVALVGVFLRWRRRQADPISARTAREGWSALAAIGALRCRGVALAAHRQCRGWISAGIHRNDGCLVGRGFGRAAATLAGLHRLPLVLECGQGRGGARDHRRDDDRAVGRASGAGVASLDAGLHGLAGQVWWVWSLLRFVPPMDWPP